MLGWKAEPAPRAGLWSRLLAFPSMCHAAVCARGSTALLPSLSRVDPAESKEHHLGQDLLASGVLKAEQRPTFSSVFITLCCHLPFVF